MTRNRPCRRPGCRALTQHKSGFCKLHYTGDQRPYDQEVRDPEATRFYHSARWLRIRKMKIRRDTLCQDCLRHDVVTPATVVHHVDGNRTNNRPENHRSLCASCHSATHGRAM